MTLTTKFFCLATHQNSIFLFRTANFPCPRAPNFSVGSRIDFSCSRLSIQPGCLQKLGYTLGQAKIFWATCLTHDSHQNGQEELW